MADKPPKGRTAVKAPQPAAETAAASNEPTVLDAEAFTHGGVPKRQLPSGLEGDGEVLRRVRFCQGFGSIEGLEVVTSASFDLESAPEFLALNSPVTREVSEAESSEMQDNESIEERGENNKCTAGRKDNVSSSLPRSVRVLFLRSLEPEAKLGIYEEMDTVRFVWDAWKRKDAEAIDNCLAPACDEILQNPLNPSRQHLLSLAYISRKMPEAFSFQKTYKILLKLLHSGVSKSPMNRANLLPIFASKLLYRGFVGESEWPIGFIQEVRVRFVGFSAEEDEWVNVRKCVRQRSLPCESSECVAVLPGDLILCFQEKGGALILNFGMPARDLLSHCHQWVDWWYIFHKATVNSLPVSGDGQRNYNKSGPS